MKLFTALLAALPAAAAAEDLVKVKPAASWRVSGQRMSDMRVDAEGRTYGQNGLSSHRLRLEPLLELGAAATITTELQLATGHLGWDPVAIRGERSWGLPRSDDGAAGEAFVEQVALRKLFLTWTTPVGQLRIGRMASHWGTGILANGGDDETPDWGAPRFGADRNYGDVVDRALILLAPLTFVSDERWASRWSLGFGADLIERDERTVRADGDFGRQLLGVLRYANKQNELGFYVANRDAVDARGDTLRVTAYDFFGKGAVKSGAFEIGAAGEVAWVLGETTLGRNNAFPNSDLTVQQLGWVARLGATYTPHRVGLDVEVGYASGDSNPNDSYVRNFTFDPDYNPSLILFEEMRAAETVAAAANAADPSRVGVPSDAVRLIPTNGSVTNAIYVRPTLRARFLDEALTARLAVLYATAEEDVVDPFGANANAGGAGVNYQGGASDARGLGLEVDVGVDCSYELEGIGDAVLSLEGGRFWPGDGFANAAGQRPAPVNLVFARLLVRWAGR